MKAEEGDNLRPASRYSFCITTSKVLLHVTIVAWSIRRMQMVPFSKYRRWIGMLGWSREEAGVANGMMGGGGLGACGVSKA